MRTHTRAGAGRFPLSLFRRRSLLRFAVALFCLRAVLDAAPAGLASVASLKQLSLEELMDLEVTSVSRQPEKLIDAASAIQVITGGDIRRSGAQTIAEALRLADNLNIAQKNPHDWAISARGFNANVGNKLLVLIDGRSVYTPLFSGVFWNAQDLVLEDVDRIEVISGPGGTLWGANAVNGVIAITTKGARDTQGLFFASGLGDELRTNTSVRYGGRLAPNVYFRVYGKFLDHAAGLLASGAAADNAWTQGRGGFRLDAATSPHDTFTVQGDAYRGDLDLQSGGTARISGGNLLGRWTHELAADSTFDLQLYFDRTYLTDPFPASPFAPAGLLKDQLDTYDLDFQHRFRLGPRQRLVWGLGYRVVRDHVLQPAPNVTFLPLRITHHLPSAFLQDEIQLQPGLALTLGSKLERSGYTGTEVEPSVRLQWSIAPRHSLWSAVSRAVRTPSRFDRDLFEPNPPPVVLGGGPQFVSETVIAYEAGYRAQWTPRCSGAVSLFYNDYDRLRSWGITPVTLLPITFQNNLDAKTHGIELTTDWQVTDRWRLNAGFSLLREHVRVKPGFIDLQNALDETADPKHQATLRSSLDLTRSLEFDTALRWVDSLRVNQSGVPGTVPAYAELDLRLGWHPSAGLEFSVIGRNLLHARHPEFGPPGPQREELPRSLFASVTWHY